ncbi:MAG: hypothetical protein AAFQ79_08410 [Pseudomonadota bacterium]
MKNVLTFAAALGLAATAAIASTDVEDTDGDGFFSMEELMVAYPSLTEDIFGQIDTDADGSITEDELSAALEAGTLQSDS